ncbi:hypothetical protein BH10CHL1_BH10CHL1_30830 [soil metagenome]
MRLSLPDIAGVAQITSAYTLGEGTFDASALAIDLLKGWRCLSDTGGLERLVLHLWAEGHRPSFSTCAVWAMETGSAVTHREFDLYNGVFLFVDGGCPTETGASSRANGLLTCPINDKILRRKASSFSGLTMVVTAHRPKQVQLVALVALYDQFGIDKTSVSQMDRRQEVALLEGTVNDGSNGIICGGCGCRFDVSNQVRQFGIATLSQMDLYTQPRRYYAFGCTERQDHGEN